jgi:DNA-directed RNA polymerase specialized sigma24 family protein
MPLIYFQDAELLRLIRSQKKEGAEALYDQYARVLGLAIFRIIQNRRQTENLLEEALVFIWNKTAQYTEQDKPLLTWTLEITKGIAKKKSAEAAIATGIN